MLPLGVGMMSELEDIDEWVFRITGVIEANEKINELVMSIAGQHIDSKTFGKLFKVCGRIELL